MASMIFIVARDVLDFSFVQAERYVTAYVGESHFFPLPSFVASLLELIPSVCFVFRSPHGPRALHRSSEREEVRCYRVSENCHSGE